MTQAPMTGRKKHLSCPYGCNPIDRLSRKLEKRQVKRMEERQWKRDEE